MRLLYALVLVLLLPGLTGASDVRLTAEERTWLDEHGQHLHLSFEPKFPPIEFLSPEGSFAGLSADLMAAVEKRLDVTLIKTPVQQWTEVLDGLRSGDTAIAPSITPTEERKEYVIFTKPYASIPIVIMTRRGEATNLTLDNLDNRIVDVVRGYASADLVRSRAQGRFQVREVDNIREGLRDVSFGLADALVESQAVATWYISREGITNLQIGGTTGVTEPLAIGISSRYPLLASAVQKAVTSIPPQEMQDIVKKWVSLDMPLFDPDTLLAIKIAIGLTTAVVCVLLLLAWRLRHRLREKMLSLEQTQEVLKENLSRFQMTLDVTHAGFWEYYPQENREENSPEWYTMLGYPAQYGSRTLSAWTDLLHPDDREDAGSRFQEYLNRGGHGVYEQEFRMRTADETWCWVLGKGRTVEWDRQRRPVKVIGINLDINKVKEAQQAQRRSEDKFARLFQLSPDIVILTRQRDGTLMEANDAALQLVGFQREEAIGRSLLDLNLFEDPSRRDVFLAQLYRDGMVENFEFDIRHKQGHILRCSASSRPLVIDDEPCNLTMARDVTRIRMMEEMLVQTEKMHSLGGIAAGIAHEINNPLGIILQGVQTVSLRLQPDFPKNQEVAQEQGMDPECLRGYLEKRKIPVFLSDIEKAALRASQIIRHMLDFSRKSESKFVQCSIPELVEKAISLASNDFDLKKNYDFRSIQIIREFDENMEPVTCTETDLEQVFLNLLKNAAQAMSGAMPLPAPPCIRITARREENMTHIEFRDNGPGIPKEIRSRIFEPFFTTKDPGVGTGLGLSVSYFIIVTGHGGSMRVTSPPEGGTVFTIDLPCLQHSRHHGWTDSENQHT